MSAIQCGNCKERLSTTADPNDIEGTFLSLVDLERYEVDEFSRWRVRQEMAKKGRNGFRCSRCGYVHLYPEEEEANGV